MRTLPTFKPASKDDPIFKEGPSLVAVQRFRPDPVPINEHAVLRLDPAFTDMTDQELDELLKMYPMLPASVILETAFGELSARVADPPK